MYTDHFGLARNPFTPLSDSPAPFRSRELKEALAHFEYAQKSREGFFLLVGEVGTGKSTAIRAILELLNPETPVALLTHTSLDARELLEDVVRRFGLESRGPSSKPILLSRLEQFLSSSAEAGPAVLIIDEAHLLSHAALEEVRLLSNLKQGDRPLLQICLVGQPELVNRLRQHRMRPLRQRIAVRYIVGSLSREESREYIAYRLRASGAAEPHRIFSQEAADAVHELTQGLPREINVVASQAMLNAFLDGSTVVRPVHVRSTKRDYGFEGVRVERPDPAREPAVRKRLEDTKAPPVAAPEGVEPPGAPPPKTPAPREHRGSDWPLQTEPPRSRELRNAPLRNRAVITTHEQSSSGGGRALLIAVGLVALLALAFLLYPGEERFEESIPSPPASRSSGPSSDEAASLAAPPPPELPPPQTPQREETSVGALPEPETASDPEPPAAAVSDAQAVDAEPAPLPAPATPYVPPSPPPRSASAADRLEQGARLARLGRLDDAIAAFREALALEPGYIDALYNLGVSLLESGQVREAVDVLREAASRSPSDGLAHRSLGIALRKAGDLDGAAAALRKSVELSPNDGFALRHLSAVLRESGRADEAVEATRRAVALNPNDAVVHQELGFALRAGGRLPEATAAFQRAIDLDASLAVAHYSLGVTLLEMGYPGDGQRQIAEARRLGFDPR